MSARNRSSSGEGWNYVPACARCGLDAGRCRCGAGRGDSPAGGKPLFRLRLEKRCGKPVTVCQAEAVSESDLRGLLKEWKGLCGTGGTFKDGAVELQGDHRDRLRSHLGDRGYRVKG